MECSHYFPRGNDGRFNRCEFCGTEKKILSIESHFDNESFLLGQNSDFKDKNPFSKNTNSWYNWNIGRNERLLSELNN